MASEQEVVNARRMRDEMLHEQKVDALQRELRGAAKTRSSEDVDAIIAELDKLGAAPAENIDLSARTTKSTRAGGAEKRG